MDKRALREALDRYAAHRLPANADLWPTIRRRAQTQRHRRPMQPRRMLVSGANALTGVTLIAIVALVLTLVLSGMNSRRFGGALAPFLTAPPTPATPPGQPYPVPPDCPVTPMHGP